MREVKFRGKKENGRWVNGGHYRLFHGLQMDGDHYSHYIVENNHHHKVNPKTVGQYTGLKDKNGVEIYEGDVVWDAVFEEYCKVEFEEGCFRYTSETATQELFEQCDQLEVIGNIYDNHEIITGGCKQ